MLAHARVLGYVFNPLTVFWCHRAYGTLACVIAEVHNTYGQRHAYLVRTDDRGRARTEKELYVSPYHPVDGWYQMSLPLPGTRLALSVTLHRPNGHRFVASVQGTAMPATRSALLRAPRGTRGPPPWCPHGSDGRASSCTRADYGRCRGRGAFLTRGFSDQHTARHTARHHGVDRPGPVA